ncbi:MAG: PEP-CTERM sorting domain-containing protein [Armatimonadota bacterium]
MRPIKYLLLSVMVLFAITSAAFSQATGSGITSEDVSFWLNDGAVWFNPSTSVLNENKDKLVLKVQQTVYNNEWTRKVTGLNTAGFLYSYLITNLSYEPNEGEGLKMFGVAWPSTPLNVMVSRQNVKAIKDTNGEYISSGWVAAVDGTNPVIYWQDADDGNNLGLMPAESVCLWAVSDTGNDCVVSAVAAGTASPDSQYSYLRGQTTGPNVPEPGSLLALSSALVGAVGLVLRRKQ